MPNECGPPRQNIILGLSLLTLSLAGCLVDPGTGWQPYGPTGDDETSAASTGGPGDTTSEADTGHGDAEEDITGADSGIDDDGNAETGDTGEVDPPPDGPARYPAGQTHSPMTPFVAENMRQIAELSPAKHDDVFMKVGASSTVSTSTLHCFVDDPVDLGIHQQLQPTLDFFLGGDAAGTTPFDRHTEAAEVGRTAGWVISGDPSPVEIEQMALSPRLGLIHYGANDMGWNSTYIASLVNFHDNMLTLVDLLIDEGVVPVLFGITRRGDSTSANRWVDTFNAVIRGIAQARQVPFVDLHHAIDPLDGHGLAGDGLHLEGYNGGACVLTPEGLEHGYNVRNLVALQALDRAKQVLIDGVEEIDPPTPPLPGDGRVDTPLVIDTLPFADVRDTSLEGESLVDHYSACDDTNESGPELWYTLTIETPRRIRAVVLSGPGVDIDVHLVDDSATGEGCIERGHHMVEASLSPGTYHFALDSWTNNDGMSFAGEYLFVLLECAPDDAACDA